MSHHHLRPLRGGRNLVDIERRRIRRQNALGLRDPVQRREDFLLQRHVLEHRFHNNVGLFEALVGELRGHQREALVHHLLREALFFHRIRVISTNHLHAAIERFLRGLFDHHRNARVRVIHRDAAAHGSRADHGRAPDRIGRRLLRHVRNLRHRALAEKRMNQRLRSVRTQTLFEQLALDLAAALERPDRRFHRFDRGQRRLLVLPRCPRLIRGGTENHRIHIRQPFPAVAHLAERFARDFAGECNRAAEQIAFDDPVHNARRQRFFRPDRFPERAHLHRQPHPGQPRQPLRPGRPRNQAQLHLRLTHLAGGRNHPVMPAHRHFQAPAECRAMQRHHHRLGRIFNLQDDLRQVRGRRFARHDPGEFTNIGAGDERASRADHDNRAHLRILHGPLHAFQNAFRHARAQRIHRRIVDGDDGNVVVDSVFNEFVQRGFLNST